MKIISFKYYISSSWGIRVGFLRGTWLNLNLFVSAGFKAPKYSPKVPQTVLRKTLTNFGRSRLLLCWTNPNPSNLWICGPHCLAFSTHKTMQWPWPSPWQSRLVPPWTRTSWTQWRCWGGAKCKVWRKNWLKRKICIFNRNFDGKKEKKTFHRNFDGEYSW